jgi:hypothetical protein
VGEFVLSDDVGGHNMIRIAKEQEVVFCVLGSNIPRES